MQQEPVTLIATRLIRYTHLLDLRASCYAAIEAQRKIIEHDGQTSSHSLSLHSLQQQAQQIESELTELGSVDFRQDLIKLDSAAKVVLSLETQFGEAIDRDEEIGGVDAVDSITDLLLGQGRPTLEVLGLREAPFWKAAAEFGYRVHRGHEVEAPNWKASTGGRSTVRTGLRSKPAKACSIRTKPPGRTRCAHWPTN